jgi:hypothetical protein
MENNQGKGKLEKKKIKSNNKSTDQDACKRVDL